MAFSKIAGFEVTPRSESSSTMRCSSPESIVDLRIWSSQTLVPAEVSAARRSLTCCTLMACAPFPFGREPEASAKAASDRDWQRSPGDAEGVDDARVELRA